MQTHIEKYNQTPLAEQFVADIRQIIATARTNAVRSVDFCRVLIMAHILFVTWQKRSNPNMVAVLEKDNLRGQDNFTANIQFRLQCGRN